jgi:hypothetical protein
MWRQLSERGRSHWTNLDPFCENLNSFDGNHPFARTLLPLRSSQPNNTLSRSGTTVLQRVRSFPSYTRHVKKKELRQLGLFEQSRGGQHTALICRHGSSGASPRKHSGTGAYSRFTVRSTGMTQRPTRSTFHLFGFELVTASCQPAATTSNSLLESAAHIDRNSQLVAPPFNFNFQRQKNCSNPQSFQTMTISIFASHAIYGHLFLTITKTQALNFKCPRVPALHFLNALKRRTDSFGGSRVIVK